MRFDHLPGPVQPYISLIEGMIILWGFEQKKKEKKKNSKSISKITHLMMRKDAACYSLQRVRGKMGHGLGHGPRTLGPALMDKREAAGLAIGMRFWSLMPWRTDASFDGLDGKADPRMCSRSRGW